MRLAEEPIPSAERSAQSARAEELLAYLRAGKDTVSETHSHTLMHQLANALSVTVYPGTQSGRSWQCVFSRPDIHLRGFGRDYTHALFLADGDSTVALSDPTFWKWVESPVDMPFIFACGEAEYEAAVKKMGSYLALVWHPKDITTFVASERPLAFLKSLVRSRFQMGALHPFDHHHPVADRGFLGRHDVLQKFRDNPQTNYALVGPSKMGKTSLVNRHLARGTENRSRQFYVDLYPLPANDFALVRALRMAIDPGSAAYYDERDTLPNFLEKTKSRLGGALEIILDEVDNHCHLPTVRLLCHLASEGKCRLILVGRWLLMKQSIYPHDDNFARLEPIVLEPLNAKEACELLERPLVDLGFDFHHHSHEFRSAVNRLGRVPGHLQEFGCFLIEELSKNGGHLTVERIRHALGRVNTASRLLGLMDDLSSDAARTAALIMVLYAQPGGETDPLWLRDQFAKLGAAVPTKQCMEICGELVIHHLLNYEKGVYHICRWDFVAEGQVERKQFEALLQDQIKLITKSR